MYPKAVNLSNKGEYQQALEMWNQIHAQDATYPDRQKVERTARKKLAAIEIPVSALTRFRINRRAGYRLGKITRKIVIELRDYERKAQRIREKYRTRKEDGDGWEVTPENQEWMTEAFEQLLDEEVTLENVPLIPFDLLPKTLKGKRSVCCGLCLRMSQKKKRCKQCNPAFSNGYIIVCVWCNWALRFLFINQLTSLVE